MSLRVESTEAPRVYMDSLSLITLIVSLNFLYFIQKLSSLSLTLNINRSELITCRYHYPWWSRCYWLSYIQWCKGIISRFALWLVCFLVASIKYLMLCVKAGTEGYSFCKEGTPWPNAEDRRSLFITLYSYWENFGWVGSIKW
jgi:hypothetical protein